MAIVWMDGFDNYANITTLGYYYTSISNAFSTTGVGRYDGFGVNVSDDTSGSNPSLGIHRTITPTSTVSMGVAVRRPGAQAFGATNATTYGQYTFWSGSNVIASVGIWGGATSANDGPTNNGLFLRNKTGVIAQYAGVPFFKSTNWNYFEIELVSSATVGQARVYVNGQMYISVTSTDFSSSAGATTIDKVSLNPGNYISSSSWNNLYDDFYITNTSARIGEMHIATLRPSADTATKQWTPSTLTTNFDKVNARFTTTGTSYVATNVANNRDVYDLQDLSAVTTINGNILAAKMSGIGYKNNFGPASVNLQSVSGATITDGTSQLLYETVANQTTIPSILMETNPNTSAAWTSTEINNLQMGIRSS